MSRSGSSIKYYAPSSEASTSTMVLEAITRHWRLSSNTRRRLGDVG